MAQSPALVAPTVDALGYPDLIGCLALICELGRILDKQDRTAARSKTASRGGEVTAEDFRFFDTIICKKAVSRLRICPVLAGVGNAFTHPVADLSDHFAKSPSESRIFERRLIDFAFCPVAAGIIRIALACSQCALKISFCRHEAPRCCESGARQRITSDSADSRNCASTK